MYRPILGRNVGAAEVEFELGYSECVNLSAKEGVYVEYVKVEDAYVASVRIEGVYDEVFRPDPWSGRTDKYSEALS
jgi:hypothetical protein